MYSEMYKGGGGRVRKLNYKLKQLCNTHARISCCVRLTCSLQHVVICCPERVFGQMSKVLNKKINQSLRCISTLV